MITYNEENKDYDFVDCIPILYREFVNPHAFIVVGTQESGTKKIKEGLFIRSEATHYPHVLGEYLEMIGYGRALKENAHKLVKIKNLNVRMRIFYYKEKVVNTFNTQNVVKVSTKNNKSIPIEITSKNSNVNEFSNTYFQTFYKGAIFFKMVINNKTNIQKFIFVNIHLYFNESNHNEGYEIRKKKFLDLMKKPVFTDDSIDKKNLLELYQNGYNIFLFGDLRFSLIQLKSDLLKSDLLKNVNEISLKSQLSESIVSVNTNKYGHSTFDEYNKILYALKTINPSYIDHQKYLFPDKSSRTMVSLSIPLNNKSGNKRNTSSASGGLPV